jgi:hypothetical protein
LAVRFLVFFEAVFDATSAAIDKLQQGIPAKDFPQEWRKILGHGSSTFRVNLYESAVNQAVDKVGTKILIMFLSHGRPSPRKY